MMIVVRRAFVACIVLALAACGGKSGLSDDTTHVMAFDTSSVRLATAHDTTRLSIELARTEAQRTMDLMERRQLAENAGMLFTYDSTQGKDAGFWMYRTRIPLDIAYLDSAGAIKVILPMVPYTATLIEGCPSYPPNVPYRYALEMNSGFFARHHADTGSVVIVRDVPATAAKAGSAR